MTKQELIKQDDKITSAKDLLYLNISYFLIKKGINEADIWDEGDYLCVYTDEKVHYDYIIDELKELNLDSIKINDGSDKTSIISLK